MRQVAVFADAGYLHAAGATVLTGSKQLRKNMDLDALKMISMLKDTAIEKADGALLLRIYWYDGLLGGQPSLEQSNLARMDNVKVRLGTVTAGQQKGVDSLIVTDLIELARNRAISDAVLLSGDEDLRVGVLIAQSFGVRVHLIGIEPSRGNQSHLLRQEADTTIEWSKSDIAGIMSAKVVEETALKLPTLETESTAASEGIGNVLEQIAVAIADSIEQGELMGLIDALNQSPENVPYDFDRRLLSEGRQRIGRVLGWSEKQRVREKFKDTIRNRA